MDANSATLPSDRQQQQSLLAGPVFLSGYFVLVYLLQEAVCRTRFISVTATYVIIAALTAVSLAILFLAGRTAYQTWQQLPPAEPVSAAWSETAVDRAKFIAFVASWLILIAFITILTMGILHMVLPLCHG